MSNDSTQKAIVNARQALADLYADACIALEATVSKERVQAVIEKRTDQAGAAEAGAELAFACLIAAQKRSKPSGVELTTETESNAGGYYSRKAVGQMIRRIRDNMP
jgi:hypothetical protein